MASSVAHAQGGALERYEPTLPGDALLAVPDMHVRGHLVPKAGLVASYANGPLVLRQDSSDLGDVVSHQLVLHAMATLPLWARLQVGVDLPIYLSQGGEEPSALGTRFASPSGADFGDVRTDLRLSLLEHEGLVPGVGLQGQAWWPSGAEGSYAGAEDPRYGVAAVFGADQKPLRYRAFFGRRSQPAPSRLTPSLGSDTTFGAGLGYLVNPIWISGEIFGSTRSRVDADLFSRAHTNLEALVSARYEHGPWQATLGAGPGLSEAAGTPRYRVVFAVSFAPGGEVSPGALAQQPKGDEAKVDAPAPRPAEPRSANSDDRDRDGVLNAKDACPDQYGETKTPPERLGCPLDSDADGILDVDDACPQQAGVSSVDPKRHGCPADGDGDGVLDADDACPREHGKRTEDPKTNGCPESVRLEGTQIVILQQVNFATGSDRIEASSFGLLTEVARVMNDHPDIVRVAVDGHTDNVGREAANMDLSRRRALSVMRWLVSHDVDERRLEARGFGPRRPLVGNDSDEHRAKNRRVEFQILKRSDQGERAWQDGPVKP
ncbi:MAG: OmpA family protein [Polyangiaceae bacterium]